MEYDKYMFPGYLYRLALVRILCMIYIINRALLYSYYRPEKYVKQTYDVNIYI